MTVVSDYTALLTEQSWNGGGVNDQPSILTYSFDTTPQSYLAGDPDFNIVYSGHTQQYLDSFEQFSAAEETMTRQALSRWSSVSGIEFVEVDPGEGELRFVKYDLNIGQIFVDFEAYAFLPERDIIDPSSGQPRVTEKELGGDVFINKTKPFTPYVITHEIGHALGLKHPFETDPTNVTLTPSLDDISNTVLSYDGFRTGNLGYLDVEAIQHVYGDGGNGSPMHSWSWNPTTKVIQQAWNSGSHDIFGTGQKDVIYGGGGNDRIAGMDNDDVLDGGNGKDILIGGDGNDVFLGGKGKDEFYGGEGIDTIDFRGEAALGGTEGIRFGYNSTDSFGNSEITRGIEIVYATDFSDSIFADYETLEIYAGDGDDFISSEFSMLSVVDGGAGIDTYTSYIDPINVTLQVGNLVDGHAIGTNGFIDIENVTGSESAETIIGSSFDNVLNGFGGADTIDGRGGDDTIIAGDFSYHDFGGFADPNDNSLFGGSGDDQITGARGDDEIQGQSGNDTIEGKAGSDTINGGTGFDTASYASSASGVNIDLRAGTAMGGDADGDTLVSIENLAGSEFDDVLSGTNGANTLQGAGGSDILHGVAGDDMLDGGDGVDFASYEGANSAVDVYLTTNNHDVGGGQGVDSFISIEGLIGSDFDDRLVGDANGNELRGGNGDDLIKGKDGDDLLVGGTGADRMEGGNGVDTASYATSAISVNVSLFSGTASGGDAAGDTLYGIENLTGSSLDDTLIGDAADNRLTGGDGNDLLLGGAGDDHIDGGEGIDVVSYADATSGVDVYLEFGGLDVGGGQGADTLVSIENLIGSTFDDRLVGDGANNVFEGGAGSNVIKGKDGLDTLVGGSGFDHFDGGDGYDIVSYAASSAAVNVNLQSGVGLGGDAEGDRLYNVEKVTGSEHADVLRGSVDGTFLEGGDGDDELFFSGGANVFDGGAGTDVANFSYSGLDVSAYLNLGFAVRTGAAGKDSIASIENLVGGNFDDRLVGDAADNVLTGGYGDDILKGAGGDDTFHGGDGDDTITGSSGNDEMYGGAGSDVLYALGGTDNLSGGDGRDFIYGGQDADIIHGDAGDDEVRGNLGNDTIYGDDGMDDLRGGGSNDMLDGGTENDFLFGENGKDVLIGGAGSDSLTGGSGGGVGDGFMDTFVYSDAASGGGGFDRIKDWEDGTDVIDLTSFGFTDFTADVMSLASNAGTNMRINFGDGEVLLVENFSVADLDAGDVLL